MSINKNIILITCFERKIKTPLFFETHEQAHKKMCECIAKELDVPIEEIYELYQNYTSTGEFEDDSIGITDDSAWAERFGNNIDWRIFDLSLITSED